MLDRHAGREPAASKTAHQVVDVPTAFVDVPRNDRQALDRFGRRSGTPLKKDRTDRLAPPRQAEAAVRVGGFDPGGRSVTRRWPLPA